MCRGLRQPGERAVVRRPVKAAAQDCWKQRGMAVPSNAHPHRYDDAGRTDVASTELVVHAEDRCLNPPTQVTFKLGETRAGSSGVNRQPAHTRISKVPSPVTVAPTSTESAIADSGKRGKDHPGASRT
jgi:hypothetical protein